MDNGIYQLYGFNIVTSEIPLLRDYHTQLQSVTREVIQLLERVTT